MPANSCHGFYERATNALFLYNDALTAAQGPLDARSLRNAFQQPMQHSGRKFGGLNLWYGRYSDAWYEFDGKLSGAQHRGSISWVTDMEATGSGWVQTSTWGASGAAAQAPTLVAASPARD